MRGNEVLVTELHPFMIVRFTIPMRGNEGNNRGIILGISNETFTIPMRGNESMAMRRADRTCGGLRSP